MTNTLLLCAMLLAVSAVGQEKIDWESAMKKWSLSASISASRDASAKARPFPVGPDTPCYGGDLTCGKTMTGRVSVDSCETGGIYAVGYFYDGTANQQITISAVSYDFAMTIMLGDSSGTLLKRADVFTKGATATLTHTLPYTGEYVIFVTPATRVTFGNYSVTLSCATTPPPTACTPSSGALCLSGGRFRVQANYVTSTSSGQATGVALTSDTGYFWFFNSSNVEVVIKVLDGRGVNGKFWVFAGGLTDVDTLITITDTQTGAVRTYRNPAGTKFQPIQDTTAF